SSCIAYPFLNKTIDFLKDRTPTSIQAACQKIGVTHMVSVPLLINNLKNGVLRKIRNEEPKKEKLLNMLIKISLFIQKIAPKTGDFFVRKHITKSVIKKLFGDTFAWICVGGTHVPSDSLKFINGLGHIATIGYGMTECGIIAFEPGTVFRKRIDGTTGPLMHGFIGKIVNTDGNETDTGELLLKGTSMHSGKMQNGEMISSDVDEDGWLHTGDIARFVNGSLVIEGRLKEVILNESGENIYPDELEDYFDDLSNLVKRYCVLGINSNGNEKIAIVAEVNDGADNEKCFDEISRIINSVNGQLPFLKRIKLIFAAKEPMPLANGMKVRRQKLKEMIENNKFPVTEIQMNISSSPTIAANKIEKNEGGKNSGREKSELDGNFENIKEQVIQCFAEVLDTTTDKIGDDMRFVEDLGGDSLDSLELLAMAEARFGMMIEESDYLKCRTVNDVSRLIYEKITGSLPGQESHGGARIVHADKAAARHAENVIPITKFVDSPEYKSFEARLDSLKKSKNPYYIPHDSALRDTSIVMGKEVINFGSYNYLGLSGHPQVSQAAIDAINKLGTSASGSRLLAGEKTLHREL
ncbi:non-ribosomal peptide synthetase, partial [Treponema sp. R8-4-B8]